MEIKIKPESKKKEKNLTDKQQNKGGNANMGIMGMIRKKTRSAGDGGLSALPPPGARQMPGVPIKPVEPIKPIHNCSPKPASCRASVSEPGFLPNRMPG